MGASVVAARSVVDLVADHERHMVVASLPVVNQDGAQVGVLEIEQGDEPADSIAAFCVVHQLPRWFQTAMVDSVCASHAACGRKRALVFEAPVMSPNGDAELPPGPLRLWDDEEPIAAMEAYLSQAEQLVKANRTGWEARHRSLLKERERHLKLATELEGSARGAGRRTGALAKAADVDAKLAAHGAEEPPRFEVSSWFRDRLVGHVCGLAGTRCAAGKRPLPDIPISIDGSGAPIGIIRAYEGDEVADIVYHFAAAHKLNNAVFRKSLSDYLCVRPDLSCTRTRARKFSRPAAEILGDPGLSGLPAFEVWEDEEPADAAYVFAKRLRLGLAGRFSLLRSACASVSCERGHAAVFKFPVHEGGEAKGDIELFEDQLPADAVYDFCRRKKYLQPKYTDMGVRASLHADFCRSYNASHLTNFGEPMDAAASTNCDAGPAAAREALTSIEFTVSELKYDFRFYDNEFPPDCPSPQINFSVHTWHQRRATPVPQEPSGCGETRHLRAAAVLCARIYPPPPGCEVALGPAIAERIARAERRRYEIVTPFGYDYYLPLKELRDATNDTLVRAYFRELGPLPPILVAARENASRLNLTVNTAVEPSAQAARASLAAVRGRREVFNHTIAQAAQDYDDLRQEIIRYEGVNETHFDQRLASLSLRLAASTSILNSLLSDLERAQTLLEERGQVLDMANSLFNDTRPQANRLETRSRVLKEAFDTFSNRKERETHDKPCEKIFGACCAKETANGGKDIKCGGDATDF